MNWQQVCEDPNLKDLPYKIELNERGQILMSPARLCHSAFQGKIIKHLITLMEDGEAFPECAISTTQGTKVADVVWCSSELWGKIKHEIESSIAPEICVEVISPANTNQEMDEKRNLYFSVGAREVWICDEKGAMQFSDASGKIESSEICPLFPNTVEL